MARLQVRSFLLTLVTVLALVGVTNASASAPTSARGTFTYTSSTFNSIRSAGGNTIIDLSATVSYTGTFNGTSTLHGSLIFHPNGTATFHDVETFTGTVNGVPGTVTFNLNGSSDAAGVVSATNVVVRGTGELANLHGVLREIGTVGDQGPVGTYTGQIHVDD